MADAHSSLTQSLSSLRLKRKALHTFQSVCVCMHVYVCVCVCVCVCVFVFLCVDRGKIRGSIRNSTEKPQVDERKLASAVSSHTHTHTHACTRTRAHTHAHTHTHTHTHTHKIPHT